MRKLLTLSGITIAICVFALAGGNASAQPSEEMQQQMRLMRTLMEGIALGPEIFRDIDKEQVGMTDEQIGSLSVKMMEALRPLEQEMQKKFGSPSDITQEHISDIAETASTMMSKASEIYRTVLNDAFPPEMVKRFDTFAFQRYGGVFGGSLNVENLATLNLSAEQKEKAAKIVEQLNRERFELIFSLRFAGGLDNEEKMKEILEKIVSLTQRGQNEIEALLTPEQKKLVVELMADVPEKHRFLDDYLKNRPWRLDESSWKPGDGAPPKLDNYPGEMRPESTNTGGGGRVFPGN